MVFLLIVEGRKAHPAALAANAHKAALGQHGQRQSLVTFLPSVRENWGAFEMEREC